MLRNALVIEKNRVLLISIQENKDADNIDCSFSYLRDCSVCCAWAFLFNLVPNSSANFFIFEPVFKVNVPSC